MMRLLTSPLLPYVAAGAIAVAAFSGWKIRDWQCDAAVAVALERAEKNRAAMQETIDVLSASYETERDALGETTVRTTNTVREIYRTLPPVATSCAPTPDTVRLLQGSLDSANAAAAGELGG